MRTALISDIHANLVALEAVLADLRRERVERVICLGDVAVTGPQPRQSLDRLRDLKCPVVMGNGDDWLLDPQPWPSSDEANRWLMEIDFWCAEQLSSDHLGFATTFQPTVEVPLGDSTLLCFHGSPQSNTDIITSTTPGEDLEPMLAGFEADVMAGGHTHQPMLRRYGDVTLINPGSVGLPYVRSGPAGDVGTPPWAEYALVGWVNGRLSVEFRYVPVDVGAVVRAALSSGMPHAERYVEGRM